MLFTVPSLIAAHDEQRPLPPAATSFSHRSPPSGIPRHRWPSTASPSSSLGKLSPPSPAPSSSSAQHPGSAPTTSSWRDLVFLLMSVSFACLSIMSLRNPFAELATVALDKSDLQSIFCLLVFCIVILVLGESPLVVVCTPCAQMFVCDAQHTSQTQPKTLSAHTSPNSHSAIISVASMTISIPRTARMKDSPPASSIRLVFRAQPRVPPLIVTAPSTLQTAHRYLSALLSMFSIALPSSPSQP